ncbi:MAG: ribonuclease M5 [Clostridiales bacterium]|jgi:ribonuclease M5|nr:ribonuclease M5 [Clostridiales bacterium]
MIMKINEIIIVEGKDDQSAIKKALDAEVIVTGGHGITENTWNLIKKAYSGPGIIILTDPDFSGEMIRKRIQERFPKAKHAYISRADATKKGDVGVENASSGNIIEALKKARCKQVEQIDLFSMDDLLHFGLVGLKDSSMKRDKLGSSLGIGYGNTKTFLKRLNNYGITREEFYQHGEALFAGNGKQDKK